MWLEPICSILFSHDFEKVVQDDQNSSRYLELCFVLVFVFKARTNMLANISPEQTPQSIHVASFIVFPSDYLFTVCLPVKNGVGVSRSHQGRAVATRLFFLCLFISFSDLSFLFPDYSVVV